jgi:hypothetical protein
MLNLFLDLRNTNFNDEQTLNFKCFTVNNINFLNFKEFKKWSKSYGTTGPRLQPRIDHSAVFNLLTSVARSVEFHLLLKINKVFSSRESEYL